MILSSSASIQNMLMIRTSCISTTIPLQLHYKMTLRQPIHGPVKMTWSSMQQRPRSCVLISANLGDLSPSYRLTILLLRLSASKKFWEKLSVMTSNGTSMLSTSLAKPHSDYIYWCYAVELVSPQMKCYVCTQPKSDRYWNLRVPHDILAWPNI